MGLPTDLVREELRLIDHNTRLVGRATELLREAERFRTGPDADQARYTQLYEEYMLMHAEYMLLYEEIKRIHAEVMGRQRTGP